MKLAIAAISSVLALVAMPSSAQYTGEPLANKMPLKVGKAMGGPMDLTPFVGQNGKPGQITHRRNDMLNQVLSCYYNAGNFMASHSGDYFAIGVSDLPLPLNFYDAGCGQCFLFTHIESGRQAIGVLADNCGTAIGCQGAFDISDTMTNQLLGGYFNNIQYNEVTVTPVECDWGANMQYVFVPASKPDLWSLNIQRVNVPIKKIVATYKDARGKINTVEGKNEGAKWSFQFFGAPASATFEMTSTTGKVVTETITPPPGAFEATVPLNYNNNDVTLLPSLPIVPGTVQF
jgi:hypothetical protein